MNKITKNLLLGGIALVLLLGFLILFGPVMLHRYGIDTDAFDYFTRYTEDISEVDYFDFDAANYDIEKAADVYTHSKKSYDGNYQIIKDKYQGWEDTVSYGSSISIGEPKMGIHEIATHAISANLYTYDSYLEYIKKNNIEQVFTSESTSYLIIESAYNFAYRVNTKINDVEISRVVSSSYSGEKYDSLFLNPNSKSYLAINVYLTETKNYSAFQFLGPLDPFNLIKKDTNKIIIPVSGIEDVSDIELIKVYTNNYDNHAFDKINTSFSDRKEDIFTEIKSIFN